MKKNEKIDITLINMSFLWLIIPNIIFIIGNLKFYFSIPIIFALLLSWRQVICTPIYSKFVNQTITLRLLIILFVLASIIMFSCGIGISTRGDLFFRRAFLNDLIYSNWPVSYLFPNGDIGVFIYYIGDFLPAAVVGKIFGLKSAYFFLNCWNSIGLFLIFYLFIRFVKIFKVTPVLIFLIYGTLNWFYELFSKGNTNTGPLLEHVFHFSYQTIPTDIFWCFNQSVPAIIITLLLVIPSKHNIRNYFFIFSLGFIFCPIPLLGLIPILLYLSISKYNLYKFQFTLSSFKRWMILFVSFQNIVIPLCLLTVFIPFYINIKLEYANFFVWQKYSLVFFIKEYIPFIFLNFMLYAILIYKKVDKVNKGLFNIIILTLLVIPFYRFGMYNDFAMRGSIPAIVLFIAFIVTHLYSPHTNKKLFLAFLLGMGSLRSFDEFFYSYHDVYNYINRHNYVDPSSKMKSLYQVIGCYDYLNLKEYSKSPFKENILSSVYYNDSLDFKKYGLGLVVPNSTNASSIKLYKSQKLVINLISQYVALKVNKFFNKLYKNVKTEYNSPYPIIVYNPLIDGNSNNPIFAIVNKNNSNFDSVLMIPSLYEKKELNTMLTTAKKSKNLSYLSLKDYKTKEILGKSNIKSIDGFSLKNDLTFSSGIYQQENNYFSASDSVEIILNDKEISSKGLAIVINVFEFLNYIPDKNIVIEINGKSIKKELSEGRNVILIDQSFISKNEENLIIRLNTNYHFIVSELFKNDDNRRLSFQLIYIGKNIF